MAEPLSKRVLGDERFELGYERGVAAAGQIRFDSVLDSFQPELFEPGDLGLREPLVREVGKRGSTPEIERLAQHSRSLHGVAGVGATFAGLDESHEAIRIDLLLGDVQHVAAMPEDDQLRRAPVPVTTQRLS